MTVASIIGYIKGASISNRALLLVVDSWLRILHIDHFQDAAMKGLSSSALQILEKETLRLFPEVGLGARTVINGWALNNTTINGTAVPTPVQYIYQMAESLCITDTSLTKSSYGDPSRQDENLLRLIGATKACREHFESHEVLQAASSHSRKDLLLTLRNSFLAQICSLSVGKSLTEYCDKGLTLYDWTRSFGAESIFSSFPIKLILAHVNNTSPEDVFGSRFEKHLVEEYCHHLAMAARLSNDCGGVERDRSEHNVNAVDFPGFKQAQDVGSLANGFKHEVKDIQAVIQYERGLRDNALDSLKAFATPSKSRTAAINVLGWYRDVVDCFDDLYTFMYSI